VLPLGVDIDMFSPAKRDPNFRRELGLGEGDGPLLIYSGRVDNEKRADRLVSMFQRLPRDFGAAMVMVGDGKLMGKVRQMSEGLPVAFLGFEQDRGQLARALASSDIYVSAMADETFGVSVIEAQACGLPVVGVASGAMPDRVPAGLGLLGPVDDTRVMAANVQKLWAGDHDAVGAAARAHVEANFSWKRTFERLLGDIYPKAMEHTAERMGARRGNREAVQTAFDPALLPAE
jgi:alpha-1,6-mannosyltransferase